MCRAFTSVLLALIFFEYVNALDVVAGKSGEEQVKEALERAQKESEEAARKDKQESISEREQLELKHFLKGRQDTLGNHALLSSDLANVLGRKVDELRKYASNRGMSNNNNQMTLEGKTLKHEGEELAAMKEDSDSMLERESDRKMVEMARKLNNLVQKFQRKIGRLSERNHAVSYLNLHPRIATFLHARRHPIPPMKYAQFMSHLKGSSFSPESNSEENSQVKSIRGNPKKPAKDTGIDLMALKKALGLLHKGNGKGDAKNGEIVGSKTSYKEDTKLEDRLAMEAEEEKKFSNSDSYEYGMGGGGGGGGSKSSAPPQATFSPKEQASKEMQSYNDLISSESNRELSQIQDEITKATQSSMGQVSVVGQKERVQTENPESPLGGIGSLDGIGSFSQESGGMMGGGNFNEGGNPSLKGAIDSNSIGPPGSSESFPGSAAANEALESALQASANADMNGESMTAQQIQGTQGPSEGDQGEGQQQESAQEMGGGNQAPIEIGGSMQEQKQDMNAMSAGSNPFEGQGGNQMESSNQMMQQMNGNSFMQEGGG